MSKIVRPSSSLGFCVLGCCFLGRCFLGCCFPGDSTIGGCSFGGCPSFGGCTSLLAVALFGPGPPSPEDIASAGAKRSVAFSVFLARIALLTVNRFRNPSSAGPREYWSSFRERSDSSPFLIISAETERTLSLRNPNPPLVFFQT